MQDHERRTELWSSDPVTGESILVEVFSHPLDDHDLRAFAVAVSLPYIDDLTVDDLWSLR